MDTQSTKWEAGLLELQHYAPCGYLDLMPDLSSSLPPRSRDVVLLDRYHNYISMTSGQAPITVDHFSLLLQATFAESFTISVLQDP